MGNELNILCFGDSLTAGYYRGEYYYNKQYKVQTNIHHSPYANTLQELISKNIKSNKSKIKVYEDGLDGDRAENMPQRLKNNLKVRDYDLVLIIAGTNDLAFEKYSENDIIKNIKILHEICHNKNIPTMISTIPQTEYYEDSYVKRRNNVNNGLNIFYKEIIKNNKIKCIYFDFNKKLPFHEMKKNDQKLYWGKDGLHLTPKGYQFLASLIFETIKPFLIQNISNQKSDQSNNNNGK